MPRWRSMAIQSDVAWRSDLRALTVPASLMALPNKSSFSVTVVLPASGWEMMAKVRRRAAAWRMSSLPPGADASSAAPLADRLFKMGPPTSNRLGGLIDVRDYRRRHAAVSRPCRRNTDPIRVPESAATALSWLSHPAPGALRRRCRRRDRLVQARHGQAASSPALARQQGAHAAPSLMTEEGAEGALAALRVGAGLGPVEYHVAALGGSKAIHRPGHIEQKAPPGPGFLRQGDEDEAVAEAANPKRLGGAFSLRSLRARRRARCGRLRRLARRRHSGSRPGGGSCALGRSVRRGCRPRRPLRPQRPLRPLRPEGRRGALGAWPAAHPDVDPQPLEVRFARWRHGAIVHNGTLALPWSLSTLRAEECNI